MRALPDNFPDNKQRELNSLIRIIRNNCDDVDMIILFGSYARGNWKEPQDLDPKAPSGHASDYDILVVTGEQVTALDVVLWDDIKQKLVDCNFSAYPTLLQHDIEALNIKLAEGQYFFTDVKEEGCLLYDSGKHTLSEKRELTSKEKQRIAQDHYDDWYDRAAGFYRIFEFCLDRKEKKLAAFNLHQTVESCYKTILLVYTNYCPQEHYLRKLGIGCEIEDDRFANLFPMNSREEKDRFKLLEYAYIGARYDARYRITEAQLKALALPVKRLLEIAEVACKEKITQL